MDKVDLVKVDEWVIDNQNQLGNGSYGEVVVCYHESDENKKYAAKKIPYTSDNKNATDKINTELKIMSRVNNPYVVKMHTFKKTKKYVYIIMDLCNEGSLTYYIKKQPNQRLEVNQALDFFSKMINGYQALREHKVIHRDIKPDNILIHNQQPKITDFGLGKIYETIQEMQQNQTKSLVGSEYYMAPELLKYVAQAYKNGGKLQERPHYTDKCDIWSMGIVFYFMLVSGRPWDYNQSTENYLNNIQQYPVKLDPSWPLVAKHLLTRMLTIDVEQRISWEQLFQHPMINQQIAQQFNPQQLEQQCIQEIMVYQGRYAQQFQQQLQQFHNSNGSQAPMQHVTSNYMPKKVGGDSVEMSIENMEEEDDM